MNIIGYLQLYIKIKIKFEEKEEELFFAANTSINSPLNEDFFENYLNEAKSIFENLGKALNFEVVSVEFCTKEEHSKSDGWPEYNYLIRENKEVISLEPRNV